MTRSLPSLPEVPQVEASPARSGVALREAASLLSELERSGVEVETRDGELRFRAPKGLVTPELRARLLARREHIRAVLERRAAAASRDEARPPRIERADRAADLPLSFAQERLWFLEQWQPGDWVYNGVNACRMSGPLDVAVLKRTVEEIVRRHEILRTTFPAVDGRPVQRVSPSGPLPLPVADLRHLPEGERWTEACRLMTEESRRPFDLASGPLVRGLLIRLADEEHVWVPVMHHVVCDAWSNVVSSREMEALYLAFAAGKASPLPDLGVQYADFAVWQRAWLQGPVLERELAYWKDRLEGLPVLELPTDRPRPPVQTFHGATHSTVLPADLADRLREAARKEGATPFMMLLAAFKTLLVRYTGQEDIAVGTPVAGRNRPEIEELIGFFVNMLVLRTDCSEDPPFRTMLRRVRESCLGAYAHQDLPFEKLVEELQPQRDLSRTPLFQVMFSLQGTGTLPQSLGGASLESIAVESARAKFDLTLTVTDEPAGLRCSFEYSTDLFDVETIARMAQHYRVLLEAIVEDPGRRISALPMLTEAERGRMLTVWNDTAQTYPDACLHELFEAQARRTPERIAIVGAEESVSYGELDARAGLLARRLRALGVGPGDLVGVLMERSIDMVTALLGTLKAGAAYVPLDPTYPRDRVAFMAEDARLCALVSERSLAGHLPSDGVPTVHTDAAPSEAELDPDALREAPMPEHLAYVIYTSGSTGKPKGVEIPHRALVNFLWSMREEPGLADDDVLFAVTSISFDIAALELFLPLVVGARVVLADRETASDGIRLREAIERSAATVLQATPSTWRMLLEVGWHPPAGLKMLCGGEPLPPELAARLLDGGGELWNVYGPTETTVWSSVARVTPDVPISIGRPIANTQIYLLDRHRNPVPIGVPGELYIGGDGLACGYLRRPELTEERFVPNPFSTDPGSRLYRTGDLARFRCNGTIECLGRLDHQVKIRGHRIELGEIEANLGAHPNVRQAVVVARVDDGASRLVAYVVPRREPHPTVTELRDFLRRALPEPMIPQLFVVLDVVPLTPNGKIDRAALPSPDGARPWLDLEYAPPGTPIEQILAAVWAGVLGLDRVGIDDNFFDLGGDSISSVRVVARAAREGIRLTPKQIFLHQTVRQLSAAVGDAPPVEGDRDVVTGLVPLTPIQRWFFEQDLPVPSQWNEALLLDVERLEPRAVERAVAALLAHHDSLRSRFIRGPSGWEQAVPPPDDAAPFTFVDLSSVPGDERPAAIEATAAELHAGLDLARGPLFRVALFDRGERDPAALLLVAHHLVVDGVSWMILLDDLRSCLEQLRERPDVELPPKTTSFKSWAERLVAHARSGALADEAPLWASLAEAAAPRLPVDHRSERSAEGDAALVEVSLEPVETAVLLRRAPGSLRASADEILLAALAVALAPWVRADSLLVDVMRHGRESPWGDVDLSRTVGWCAGLVPVALPLDPEAEPIDVVRSVRDLLRRLPNGGSGFGLLRYVREGADGAPRVSALPPPEVLFNYQGRLDGALGGPLLRPSPLPAGPGRHPAGRRPHPLEIRCFVLGGRLHAQWSYGADVHRQATIERVAGDFARALRSLVEATPPVSAPREEVLRGR